MIVSRRIKKTLRFLESEYDKSLSYRDQEIPTLYSKMAILEYCGWLELTFDEIARNCVRRKLRTASSKKMLEDKIKATHGLNYKEHFRPLLAYGLGINKLIKIELFINRNGDIDKLKSSLARMNKMRREAAHTFTSGRTSRFDAPSTIIANFKVTEPVLQKIWKCVCDD